MEMGRGTKPRAFHIYILFPYVERAQVIKTSKTTRCHRQTKFGSPVIFHIQRRRFLPDDALQQLSIIRVELELKVKK